MRMGEKGNTRPSVFFFSVVVVVVVVFAFLHNEPKKNQLLFKKTKVKLHKARVSEPSERGT